MGFIQQCVVLSLLFTLCLCYDSHESQESYEDLFRSRLHAHTFFNTPRGSTYNNYNYKRLVKSPAERRAEICEDMPSCRSFANRYGYQMAYGRHFASHNPGGRRY